MPLALVYLTTDASYGAVASVARALGRLARRGDPAGLQHLRRLFEAFAGRLRAAQQRLAQEQLLEAAAAAAAAAAEAPQRRLGGAGSALVSSWRCECAAVVAVMVEVLFGASAAWEAPQPAEVQPRTHHHHQRDGREELASASTAAAQIQQQQQQGSSSSSSSSSDQGVSPVGQPDLQYESLVMQLLEMITNERLWGQPTTQPPRDDSGGEGPPQPPLPAQILGENALMLRTLCDAAGALARALGVRFRGRPLRTALLPLLERLGDPCALVADAAAGALGWVCIACAHGGGLGELVGANADYVIDGLCARLRGLRRHPRAPQLLAALLQKCGVAPELLPLMSEPLSGALGVSGFGWGVDKLFVSVHDASV